MKICFFSPQILYIVLLWNALNLCSFTIRVSGELTKFTTFHHLLQIAVLRRIGTYHIPHVSHFFFPLRHLSQKFCLFVLKLNQFHSTFCKTCAIKFCKISGEITSFSGKLWWFKVSSPLTLLVKLHKFTIWMIFKKTYDYSWVNSWDVWLFVGNVRLSINVSELRSIKMFKAFSKGWFLVISPLS